MKCCPTLGLCLLLAAAAHGQSDTEPVPDLGGRTPDGFLVKCYWVGTFKRVEKLAGQGVVGAFGQALSPLNCTTTTTASIIITEEVDNNGQRRAVVRGGNWECKVTDLNYLSKNGQSIAAGPDGSGGGRIPTSGPDAPTVALSNDANTVGIALGWSPGNAEVLGFDISYYPLEFYGPRGLDVRVSGEQKTERRYAQVWGMNATEEPVRAGRHTVIRQEWGDPGQGGVWYAQWTMTRVCKDAKLKLITPRGDPRTAPRAAGDGQNEFTFDSNTPGKLVINFKASVTPSSAINSVAGRVSFTCEGISGSSFAWDTNNTGGKAKAAGGYLVAKATFTGLPQKNDDFGRKRVELLLDGERIEETRIEVFFPLYVDLPFYAENHPGGQVGSPNFYHYYLQTVPKLGPKPNIEYSTVVTSAYYPSRNKIYLDKITIRPRGVPYGTRGTLSGIDAFAWAATHEMQHYKDWADAWDVENSGTTKKTAAIGKTGPADDRDNESIPNQIEDKNLNSVYDAGDLYDWQDPKTPTAGRPSNIDNDFEDWNCQRNKSAAGNHTKDWADPGMQHLTLDKWDD